MIAKTGKTIIVIPLMAMLIMMAASCRRELPETLDAYHVRYDIQYLEKMAGDIPTNILPRVMDAYYTRHYVYTEIEGFLGQFKLVQIADLRKKQVTSLLHFFGSRIFYVGEPGQLPAGIAEPEELILSPTGDTMRIGGLLSEKMDAVLDGESFPIYYTRDFAIKHANISTPYRSVDHPLTDFRIQLSYLKMHATCASMEEVDMESSLLQVPDNFKQADRASMEKIINSLFTKE